LKTKDRDKQSRRSVRKQARTEAEFRTAKIDLSQVGIGKYEGASSQSLLRCYARSFGNCGGSLSREHFIPASVLKQLGPISSEGFPFIGGPVRNISVESLASRILCREHNSFLSPLDSFAGQFFDFLSSFDPNDRKSLICYGPTLEKFLCKVLIGFISAGIERRGDRKSSVEDIPQEALDYLFLDKKMPEGWGLYGVYHKGDQIQSTPRIKMTTLFLEGMARGIRMTLGAMEFWLVLQNKEKSFNTQDPSYSGLIYRLNAIKLPCGRDKLRILWPKGAELPNLLSGAETF
jgi:hypothetical protein